MDQNSLGPFGICYPTIKPPIRQITSGDFPSTRPSARSLHAGRDVLFAQRDNYVYNFASRSQLRCEPIETSQILESQFFLSYPSHEDLKIKVNSGKSVIMLVGERDTGKRESALQALANSRKQFSSLFEVFPDWDGEPDVDGIPCTHNDAYVLDLNEIDSPLNQRFVESLEELGKTFFSRDAVLVVLTPISLLKDKYQTDISNYKQNFLAYTVHHPPRGLNIAEMHLRNTERHKWLRDPESVFHDVLNDFARPRESFELSQIILRAKDKYDKSAVEQFKNWPSKIAEWFLRDSNTDIDARGTIISLAVLDGEHPRVILDAKDALLADPRLNWKPTPGGPLAGLGGNKLFQKIGVSADDSYRVSINQHFPGIDKAIIENVWETRPQMVPVITDWLIDVTSPNGVAPNKTRRVAEILTVVSESQGISDTVDVIDQWLSNESRHRREVALETLDDLATRTKTGPDMRRVLSTWARHTSIPRHQRAVLDLCTKSFGAKYPHLALGRIRNVIERTESDAIKSRALETLARIIIQPETTRIAQSELMLWLLSSAREQETGIKCFQALFTYSKIDSASDVNDATVSKVISSVLEDNSNSGSLDTLKLGWFSYWYALEDPKQACQDMLLICKRVESGELPWEPIEDLFRSVFSAMPVSPDDGTFQVLFGESELGAFRELLLSHWRKSWPV